MFGIPVNKIIILLFVGFISKEIYDLYVFCQPIVAASGASVKWDLAESDPVDVCVFLSTTDRAPPPLKPPPATPGSSSHVFIGEFQAVSPVEAADQADLVVKDLLLPSQFYRNGTVYLHVVVAPAGRSGKALRHEVVRISRHVLQADRKVLKRNLLTNGPPPPPGTPGAPEAPKPVSSLPRVVEVGFVQEVRPLDKDGLFDKGLNQYVKGDRVLLPLFVNTLVSPRDEYMPLQKVSGSDDDAPLPGIDLHFRNVGFGYWTMQFQISLSFDEAEKTMGLNEYDIDSFKQMIGGSSPYKILTVYSVAILHLIFEYLAFSSDINFWRAKTSFEGLSSSSVTMQAGMNIIMFLYVQEQKQTKFVMYFIGFRFLLQMWKLKKLTTFVRRSGFPYVRWVNRGGAVEGMEELTDIDDAERRCMRGLWLVLIPVIAGFCIYRLIYHEFRSWYSWIVLSLAIASQMGGFVVMTPQVFMNYRLKSVAHLPWRALTFQAINTFIDDIFALCIRMPEVQKYSVFRDDIIFAVCCYQRWIYRATPTIAVSDNGAGESPVADVKADDANLDSGARKKDE